MEKEIKSLSDWIYDLSDYFEHPRSQIWIPKPKVKEAVKRLKEVFCKCNKTQMPLCDFCREINEIFGEEFS